MFVKQNIHAENMMHVQQKKACKAEVQGFPQWWGRGMGWGEHTPHLTVFFDPPQKKLMLPPYGAFEIAFASLHIYYLRVFVLITYLQCNIFICLRYQWRTIFLHLSNMFSRIAFVSDTQEESYYFLLKIMFFRINHSRDSPGILRGQQNGL